MLRNHKKLLISCFILFLLGAVSWFAFVEYGVKWLEKRVETFSVNLRQKGYVFAYSKVDITGTPFAIHAIFQNPHIKDPQGLFEWQGHDIKIITHPWNLYTLTCTFGGNQKVIFPLSILQFEGTEGTVHLNAQGMPEDVVMTVHRLASVIGTQLQPLFLQQSSLNITNLVDPLNLKISFATTLMNLETLLNINPLDHPFTINLEASLSGFQSKTAFPKSLAAWQDGGGVLEVSLLKLNWPPMAAELEGTLTLDQEMYPLGSFSSRLTGYQEALTTMVQLGWVKKKNAAATTFMLDLLSTSDKTGQRQLTIPITLQNKKFSLGPAPLFKLRPLE